MQALHLMRTSYNLLVLLQRSPGRHSVLTIYTGWAQPHRTTNISVIPRPTCCISPLTSNMHFLSRLTPTPLLYTIWKIYLVATDHCYMAVWHLSIVSILASFSTHQLPLKSILYLLCTRLSKKSVNTCSYPGILPYPAEFWLQQSENTTKDSNITLCFATNCECSYRWSCNML